MTAHRRFAAPGRWRKAVRTCISRSVRRRRSASMAQSSSWICRCSRPPIPKNSCAALRRTAHQTAVRGRWRGFRPEFPRRCPFSRQHLPAKRFHRHRGPADPEKSSTLEDIGLPPAMLELIHQPRGLILVTGPTGSGKSTSLASMIDVINSKSASTSLRSKTRSSISTSTSKASSTSARSAWTCPPSPRRSSASCGRIRTSSWSVKCAISKPWRPPSPPPKPAIWSSPPCTPPAPPARWTASSTPFPRISRNRSAFSSPGI